MIPKKVDIKVQPRSGFDKSFRNLLTAKCGTLVPLLVDELIPNTRARCHQRISVSLPPLASDTFMNVDYKIEAFAVPHRLLYGGFENFFTDTPIELPDDASAIPVLPKIRLPLASLKSGSLSDYLGCKMPNSVTSMSDMVLDAMPFLAYHRIYDDWYRSPLIQKPVFVRPSSNLILSEAEAPDRISTLPYRWLDYDADASFFNASAVFNDGVRFDALRQRNFGFDYFTMATPSAQMGAPASVAFTIEGTAEDGEVHGEGSFTIAQLRSQNSVQMFRERNNLIGTRMVDVCRGRYGAHLSDGVAQRSILLASASIPVYTKGVDAQGAPSAEQQSSNPFNSIGARYGSAYSSGELVFDYETQEPCYLFVIGSLVPRVTYSSGCNKLLFRHLDGTLASFADPILQNVGPQPIDVAELDARAALSIGSYIFGYTDRYADWMTKHDEIHGLLRDGESLEAFALQRTFAGSAASLSSLKISSNFLEIPTDFMDQVTAVADAISDYGCWIDSYFQYGVSQPLATYCLPSLQNPAYEHGNSVLVNRGGTSL